MFVLLKILIPLLLLLNCLVLIYWKSYESIQIHALRALRSTFMIHREIETLVERMDLATMANLFRADPRWQVELGQQILRLISESPPQDQQRLTEKLRKLLRDGVVRFPSVEGMTAH